MPYVGNKPEVGNFRKCDAITTSATATYNLLVGGVAVNPNQNQCIVSLNGVIQSSGTSYTIASSQITFASALTSSDVIDFILILGDTLDVGVPSDDTVDASKITANVITGQTALGATPADTDELLISDAGTLKRVDYSYLKSSVVNRPNAKNILINSDMAVAQRGTSTTGITTSAGYYASDRWQWAINHDATVTITQESLTSGDAWADGFSKSLKVDVTTADSSMASAQYAIMRQQLEGQDVQVFKKGSSNAEKYSLSFWVKATKTGTNILELWDNTNSRTCHATYTVSSSDTWEKKVVSLPADTTGAITNNNASGMIVSFWLAAGSDFTSGTLNTTWAANNNTTRASGQVNNMDSTSNNWEITGVQLEVGEYTSSTIPPFQHESYGDNLQRCLRYFQAPIFTSSQGVSEQYSIFGLGTYTASGYFRCARPLSVEMRTNPSLVSSSGSNYFFIGSGANDYVDDLTLHADSNFKTAFVYNSDEASGTAGQAGNLMGDNASAYAWLDAEL